MITPRENYLNTFLHKPTVFTPCTMTDGKIIGFGAHNGPWFEKGPEGGGYDGFGVRWVTPESGNNAAIPAPNEFLLEDITDWKDVVKFPDLTGFDWESYARDYESMDQVDRSQVLVEFGVGNGCFERLAALMGFENCLISLVSEPEACKEFFDALTDYQIEYIRQVKEHLHPDIINYYDDIATERGLFMSPATYRELIKPYHKKVFDAIHQMGMFVTQHTCGKAEDLVEDFIEIGVDQWCSVQTSNDIQALIEKYGDRITFAGGFDTNGPVARESATPDMIQAEARRVVDDYGKYHKGFALFAFFINSNPQLLGRNFGILFGEFMPYRMQVLG
jgi:hypothetical protein